MLWFYALYEVRPNNDLPFVLILVIIQEQKEERLL